MKEEFQLDRFIVAHQRDYETAFAEIKSGRKRSHWMWYIFPQVKGLGFSAISQHYAIGSLDEAIAFLKDPYLGSNLHSICHALLQLDTRNATEVFGRPDDMKLRSSMTLFAYAAGQPSVFHNVLEKYFDGRYDENTKRILNVE